MSKREVEFDDISCEECAELLRERASQNSQNRLPDPAKITSLPAASTRSRFWASSRCAVVLQTR